MCTVMFVIKRQCEPRGELNARTCVKLNFALKTSHIVVESPHHQVSCQQTWRIVLFSQNIIRVLTLGHASTKGRLEPSCLQVALLTLIFTVVKMPSNFARFMMWPIIETASSDVYDKLRLFVDPFNKIRITHLAVSGIFKFSERSFSSLYVG